jgi:putative serine protease PepD
VAAGDYPPAAAGISATMWGRRWRWLAPLGGAVAAGVIVAAVSLGGSGSSKPKPRTTSAGRTSTTALRPSGSALAYQQAITAVVRKLSPSVVQIQNSQGLGSGIVYDTSGDIVTNNHVVAGGGPYTVTAGRHTYKAQLVGSFAPDDLAVVRVSGARLRPATFANSSKLAVGDLTIAIGNPLGLRSSVTDGIVSAFRQGVSEGNGVALPEMIQTSAPINPGNSGGALADIEGRVIGIPTLAATDPELGSTAPGIGFAIPSNLVKGIAKQIIAHGHVVNSHRAYLGVYPGETNGAGVYIESVTSGGPAADAGIQPGDVVVSIDGKRTQTIDELTSVLSELKPGTTVTVRLITQRGTRKSVSLTLGTYPASG